MQTIDYALSDGVALVTLTRPEAKNAIDPLMAQELGELIAAVRRDGSVRALVLTGACGNFCAGGDVRAMAGKGERSAEERRTGFGPFQRISKELLALDRPVIAAVDGVAYGAGMSLLLMADIVLLSERARLCLVFQRIGLIPDLAALYTLPRVVGVQRAKELIFSAREVGAAEAKDMGLAMEVIAPERLLPRAMDIARSMAGASPYAVATVKCALQSSLNTDLDGLLEFEAASQTIAASSGYAREAMRRFAAKEAPQFKWADRPKD